MDDSKKKSVKGKGKSGETLNDGKGLLTQKIFQTHWKDYVQHSDAVLEVPESLLWKDKSSGKKTEAKSPPTSPKATRPKQSGSTFKNMADSPFKNVPPTLTKPPTLEVPPSYQNKRKDQFLAENYRDPSSSAIISPSRERKPVRQVNSKLAKLMNIDTQKLPPVISSPNSLAFYVEQGDPSASGEASLEIAPKVYQEKFHPQKPFHFIIWDSIQSEYTIAAVLQTSKIIEDRQRVKCCEMTKKGCNEFFLELPKTKEMNIDNISKKLQKKYPEQRIHSVTNPKFAEDLFEFEEKHPAQPTPKRLKVAVIFSNGNIKQKKKDKKERKKEKREKQKNDTAKKKNVEYSDKEQKMLNALSATEKKTLGREPMGGETSRFFDFLELMGHKIHLNTWTGYRGDMGKEGDTYYTEWNGFEIIYHVSTMLNAEQHRRLIGNDIAVIYFREGGSFDIAEHDNLGTVPQVFVVVQPMEIQNQSTPLFRVASYSRVSIRQYTPQIPQCNLFDKQSLRDFVLTKVANGYHRALSCPPMNRLFLTPRQYALKELAKKYPAESKKELKAREKVKSRMIEMKKQEVKNLLSQNPRKVIGDWLGELGMDQYVDRFLASGFFDLFVMRTLGKTDLEMMGIPGEHHSKLLEAAEKLGGKPTLEGEREEEEEAEEMDWLEFLGISKAQPKKEEIAETEPPSEPVKRERALTLEKIQEEEEELAQLERQLEMAEKELAKEEEELAPELEFVEEMEQFTEEEEEDEEEEEQIVE